MRLLSFLPMLLFVAFLPAQNDCHITGLTATVSPINPINCQYFIVLNFQHTGTTNQFNVHGNGNNYGTFTYQQVPLTLGPFTAGNTPLVREFVVRDHVFENCAADAGITVPACSSTVACNIFDVVVTPGDCQPNSPNYNLTLDFEVTGATNALFDVQTVNNVHLGTFALSALPVQITNFPASGNDHDVLRICINDNPNCCEMKEFEAPDCSVSPPCNIYDVVVTPGDCVPGSNNYNLTLDFEVTSPTNASFEVWAGNTQYLGLFPLSQLPIHIQNFPGSGNAHDIIRICMNDNEDCCEYKEFAAPDCNTTACEIVEMSITTGDCNNATYAVTVDFDIVASAPVDSFVVYANGAFFGTYGVNQLPLTIPNFPYNGGVNDVIKVCTDNAPACCRTREFPVPDCIGGGGPCEIIDLNVDTGPCNNNTTNLSYALTVDFAVVSSTPVDSFLVYANGTYFGKFGVNQLPLTIPNFPYNGGVNDVIKVCVANNAANGCCRTLEFPVPDCLPGPCEITQLVVDAGDCHNNGTYQLTINFGLASAAGVDSFRVFANGSSFGQFGINQLPLTIQQFPWNGGATDVIKICVANDQVECCRMLEFEVPDCLAGPCEVFELVVDPGQCTSDHTYQLLVNFQVASPTDVDSFDVYANGAFFGTFGINQLPLTIPNFPYNGGDNDVIKVCVANILAECCRIREFAVPDCLNSGPCEITQLVVDPGQCTSNTTYHLLVNFGVSGGGAVDSFQVFANGNFLGKFGMNQLPLNIPNFPYNGGANDVIKICVGNTLASGCCRILEFPVPGCLNNEPCHIYDLVAVHTPCLCGQFFAVLNFEFDNVGSGGFDIVGNGNNYGTFEYSHPQPIILGPFPGDGTNYEFVVRDHFHPDCHDAVEMGEVVCMVPVTDPGNTNQLSLSPNPAVDWLQVSAQLNGGLKAGQSNVEVYSTDGRLVIQQTVADGSNFQLNVSSLPAGVYRLVLLSEAGRVEGTFAKK